MLPYEWKVSRANPEEFGFLTMWVAGRVPLIVEALVRKRRPLVHQRAGLLKLYGVNVSGSTSEQKERSKAFTKGLLVSGFWLLIEAKPCKTARFS